MSVDSLAQALLETGVLDATSVQMRVPRARIGRVFLEEIIADGLLTESSLVSQLARALSVPRFDPKERLPEPEALALLDHRACEEFSAVPVAVRGGGALLWVAMCDPTDEQAQGEIARRTGRRIKACLIGPRELTRLLAQLAQGGGPQAQQAQAQSQAAQQAQQAQAAQQAYATQQAQAQQAYANQQAQAAATYRQSVPMPAMQQPMMPPGMPMPGMQVAGTMMQPGMPQPGYGYPPQQVPSGYGTGFFQPSMPAPAPVPQAQLSQAPTAAPTAAPGARPPDVARLEDELNQARQVVKVLAQLLVERGLIDGDELKRRLRAERDRR